MSQVLFTLLCSYQTLQLDKYLFAFLLHTQKKTMDTLDKYILDVDFSQIIHKRPYQFEPLSDNNERIESFDSVWEVLGTLTQSDMGETLNR